MPSFNFLAPPSSATLRVLNDAAEEPIQDLHFAGDWALRDRLLERTSEGYYTLSPLGLAYLSYHSPAMVPNRNAVRLLNSTKG